MLARCGAKNTQICTRNTSAALIAGPSTAKKHNFWRRDGTVSLHTEASASFKLMSSNRLSGKNRNFIQPARHYTSEAGPSSPHKSATEEDKPGGLFDKDANPWDHVFAGLEDLPPLHAAQAQLPPDRTIPHAAPRNAGNRNTSSNLNTPGSIAKPFRRLPRSQDMNQREVEAFQDMFDLIFSAVRDQQHHNDADRAAIRASELDILSVLNGTTKAGSTLGARGPLSAAAIGSRPDGSSSMSDYMLKIRRHAARTSTPWGAQEDAVLEKKRAEIATCPTDHALLEWAMREVFGESIRYEEEARTAMHSSEAAKKTKPDMDTQNEKDAIQPASESQSASTDKGMPVHTSTRPLQPPTFPFLLAELMRAFRDTFHDPHLALSLFTYARTRSIASYVFGCTTPAYNELLRTRWSCFHDLRGVADALREMHANGVPPDAQTLRLVEEVRREVGLRTIWQEERSLGTGEVYEILAQIERYVKFDMEREKKDRGGGDGRRRFGFGENKNKKKRWGKKEETWKLDRDFEGESSGYKFNDWKRQERKSSRPPRYYN